ncbi:radical SAM protein [Desulfuribacillus alkaliarsenatis]|uniref:Radical SAM core domain-containing protein n=1 Tax=Desulfuribacillus alkaliarsenatis TaxID=766136 RepID=A0A1E5G5N3_9FIRM|nr:radical SAM protein [Desulfuribacillus alkaliarsenatis]OEF98419.1 hypothetical protein BHF68_01715 [Desulfuribacillus alkaliarsenatis]
MKASIGTLQALGLKKCKVDAAPTTAYILSDGTCNNNCKFCSQAKDNQSNKSLLSRVAWSEAQVELFTEELGKAYEQQKLKRTCIQVVNEPKAMVKAKTMIENIVKTIDIPICVSASVHSLKDVQALLDLHVDKVSIALDAVTPRLYEQIKGGCFEKRLTLIIEAAKKYPGRISTHVIVGLGETEQEMLNIINLLLSYDITIALFAFTPVRGTKMAQHNPPPIEQYRRIQTAFYLLKNLVTSSDLFKAMEFDINGQLVDYGLPMEQVIQLLIETKGVAYETTGCDDCNRPYYNEKPGGVMYNYPRPLTANELEQAIQEAAIARKIEKLDS